MASKKAAPAKPAPDPAPRATAAQVGAVALLATAAVLASTTPVAEPAGSAWCKLYLPSTSLDDLTAEFAPKVKAMVASLEAGGAQVIISDTYRPPPRAYLMHWSCMIALSGQDPADVPPMEGVAIDWTCGGNSKLAKLRCAEMIAAYNIKFPAALVSRHTQRRAVDMTIRLPSAPKMVPKYLDGAGQERFLPLSDPKALYAFGASFGVIKLVTDSPHWSDDGH